MHAPQLLPRLVTDVSPKSSRKSLWAFLRTSSRFHRNRSFEDTIWVESYRRRARSRRTMGDIAARDDALKLCPWASDHLNTESSWLKVGKSLTKIASVPVTEATVTGDDIKFDFRDTESNDIPGLIEDLDFLNLSDTESETDTVGDGIENADKDSVDSVSDKSKDSVNETNNDTVNGTLTTNGTATKTDLSTRSTVFETTNSLAPKIHTNELVNVESTPFYHSHTLSLPTKPPTPNTNNNLIITTVSKPEVRLDCASQTVYSVRNRKAENTTSMQEFVALNNHVNSKGQTIFTEKQEGRYYLWATHHSSRANDPEKYWFYVVRASYVDTDGDLTAVIFAELTPKSGWVYDPEMHYKGQFYLAKIKPMTEKQAFDSANLANPPRADKMIFIKKMPRHLPMLEIHSGQQFISYKDKSLNYHLHWVDWESRRLWQICHIKPFQGANWKASQTRPIPILFNGGMYLIESSQIIKCYFTYDGDVPRLVSMRRWEYDQPLASKAILWADHLDAKHVVLHHTEGYHMYNLETQQHYESSINKDRPSLWSLVDGKIHKFGYTQNLLDKIEASVAKRKLQAGDRVEF